MRYERVKVNRDTNTVHNRAVAPWETPILEYIFDEGNVTRTGVFEEVSGEYPEAPRELDRLVRAYGADPKTGIPYANSVFGNAQAGVRSLRKLIEDAQAEDDEAAKEPAPVPARAATKKRSRSAVAADSLLS
jgi:hypothetical protein